MAPRQAGFREFSTRAMREQVSRRSFSIVVAREAGPTDPAWHVPLPGYVSVRPHSLADFQAGGSGLLTRSHHRDKVGNIHQPRLLCQPVGIVQPLRHDELQLLGLHLVSLVF